MSRDNLIGGVLLGLCGVVAVIMIYYIAKGTRPTYSGPSWLVAVLAIVFVGALGWSLFQAVRSRRAGSGGAQWPNPTTGHQPWWRRIWPSNRGDGR